MERIFTSTLLSFLLMFSATGNVCDPNLHSLSFDGNSCVEFNTDNDLNIPEKITVEAWIKATQWGMNSSAGSIVCKHGWTNGEQGYVLRAGGNGELSFNIAGIQNNGSFVGWKEAVSQPGSLMLNTWHHVAGTYDGKKIKIYIDGTLVKTVNFNGEIALPVNYNLRIGSVADMGAAFARPWIGYIDEVRIWSKALNENHIRSSMNNHVDPATTNDLVGYWRFDDNTAGNMIDLGSGGNDGVCVNAMQNTDVPFTNGIPRPILIEANGVLSSISISGNQWNLNGVPIPGETGMIFIPTVNGTYSVTVTDILGCTATSDEISITTVGMEDVMELSSIKYYVSGKTLVFNSLPGNFFEYDFELFDLSGRSMNANFKDAATVDLELLSPGIYILTLRRQDRAFSDKILLTDR